MIGSRPARIVAAGPDQPTGRAGHASANPGGGVAAALFLCTLLGLAGAAALPGLAKADFADAAAAYDAGDVEAAAEEWRRLAEEGNALAQVALADLYMAGQGVPRDRARARALYRAAAKAGNRVAQINLGDIHGRGLGVPRDPVRALAWFELAAEQGSGWAQERVDKLKSRLSCDELAEARRLARRFRAVGE